MSESYTRVPIAQCPGCGDWAGQRLVGEECPCGEGRYKGRLLPSPDESAALQAKLDRAVEGLREIAAVHRFGHRIMPGDPPRRSASEAELVEIARATLTAIEQDDRKEQEG